MQQLWNRLISLGDDPHLPDYLRRKLQLTNLIGFTIMVLSFLTVVWVFVGQGQILATALLGFMAVAFGLLLNFLGFFKVTRWLYCIVPVSIVTAEAAFITPLGEDLPPIRLIILAMVALPPILFESRERVSLVLATLAPVGMFMIFEPLNDAIRLDDGIPSSVGLQFRAIAFIFATSLILSAIFYLRHVNFLAEQRIAGLLDITQQQNEELKTSLEVIARQNEEITDSIRYARRLQEAILPSLKPLDQFPIKHFVIYKPKDIVSGDFYWYNATAGMLRIAAVDCTGHGVPGAFMSMLGTTVLNQIATQNREAGPRQVLELLNAGVTRALGQDSVNMDAYGPLDGMDLALIHLDFEHGMLRYAGANRPLWRMRRGGLEEFKGTRRPIGGRFFNDMPYLQIEFEVEKGDRYYIFSDGLQDQVGGPGRRKYSTKRLGDFLTRTHAIPLESQSALFLEEHLAWQTHFDQVDDQLMIGIEII